MKTLEYSYIVTKQIKKNIELTNNKSTLICQFDYSKNYFKICRRNIVFIFYIIYHYGINNDNTLLKLFYYVRIVFNKPIIKHIIV